MRYKNTATTNVNKPIEFTPNDACEMLLYVTSVQVKIVFGYNNAKTTHKMEKTRHRREHGKNVSF